MAYRELSRATLDDTLATNAARWASTFGNVAKKLHDGQIALLDHPAREKVACWGRRGGKSLCVGEIDLPRWAITHDETTQWVFSLTHDQARIIFDYMVGVIHNGPLERYVKSVTYAPFPHVTFYNDSVVHARSIAHHGQNARGHGGDRLILDECSFFPEQVVDSALSPMLAQSSYGETVQISTPNGQNHFHRSYLRGLPGDREIQSFWMPSWRNPFLKRSFLRAEKRRRTAMSWDTEYGAQFREDQASQFPWRIIEPCIDALASYEPIPGLNPDQGGWRPSLREQGRRYVIGYDPADTHDRSGVVVLDAQERPWRMVHIEDISGRGYTAQVERLKKVSEYWNNAVVMMDNTGHKGYMEWLWNENVSVAPFPFTNQSKRELIENLTVLFEQKDISFPYQHALVEELKFYRRDVSKTGTITLGAPEEEGMYDDLVTAFALACWLAAYKTPEPELSFLQMG